jgi:hypothetical protein
MESTTSLKINDRELDHIKKLDASMRQFSMQHSETCIMVKKLLATIESLEEAKVKFITEILQKHGLDTSRVVNAIVNHQGEIQVQMGPPAEKSEEKSIPQNFNGSSEEEKPQEISQ